MLICFHCNKEVKNKNSKIQHEIRCKSNPNRIEVKPTFGRLGKPGKNQYSYGKSMAAETKKKISEKSKLQVWTEDRKKKHSEIMKQTVSNFPESYSSSNRGRTKQIIFDGIKFQGKWELVFYQYCINNDINIRRCNEWFEYDWNGIRKYFPDFYLPDKNIYVEVKGYQTDRDLAKWSAFPHTLVVVRKEDIEAIEKGCFVGPIA